MAKRSLSETEEVENGENEEVGGEGRVSQSRVFCQVNDCGQDLGEVKVYYRNHRVCEYHAKAVVVSFCGIDKRYCQQCSRFQEISMFDDTKRSCRERLAGHNERRRKHYADLHAEKMAVHIPSVSDVKDKSWRVQEISKFDDTKRSCRERLAGHNERRRKHCADLHAEKMAVHIPSVSDVKDKSWRVQEISKFDDTKRSCRERLAGHNECRRKHCADLHAEKMAVHIPSVSDVKDKSWRVRGHLEHLTTRVQGKPIYKEFL